jgi:ferrochelatase
MRYGQPSFESVAEELRRLHVEDVLLVPMYPQYASASTGSAVEAFSNVLARGRYVPALSVLPPTWDDPAMLDAWAGLVRRHVDPGSVDGVIFSYHGLPERQVRACDPLAGTAGAHCCASESCCEEDAAPLHACYRAQSFATTREIAARLGLSRERTFQGFQSRLGNTKWIEPYSDALYEALPKRGVKRVAVVCPSFLTDCLETLEEVAIRGKEQFLQAGGESFVAVSCLNDDEAFLDALAASCARRMPGLT